MKNSKHSNLVNTFLLATIFVGCSPSIHLIDRQTVLDIEASGDWQELDKKFQEQEVASGPLPLENMKNKGERRKVFGMTHSDETSPSAAQNKNPVQAR